MARQLLQEESMSAIVRTQDNIVTLDHRNDDGFTHVSTALRECPRSLALSSRLGKVKLKTPKGADRIVWAMGRAAEKHWRDSHIQGVNFVGVIGKWFCKCEYTKVSGFYAPEMCPRCATPTDNYGEMTLYDHDAELVGNPDYLYLCPTTGKIRIIEIKSMNAREFQELTIPKPDHVTQGLAYQRMAREYLVRDPSLIEDAIRVVYICKDYLFAGSVYKEFIVTPDEGQVAVDLLWAGARNLKEAKNSPSHIPPRLPCCSSPASTKARNCENCVGCFSL